MVRVTKRIFNNQLRTTVYAQGRCFHLPCFTEYPKVGNHRNSGIPFAGGIVSATAWNAHATSGPRDNECYLRHQLQLKVSAGCSQHFALAIVTTSCAHVSGMRPFCFCGTSPEAVSATRLRNRLACLACQKNSTQAPRTGQLTFARTLQDRAQVSKL